MGAVRYSGFGVLILLMSVMPAAGFANEEVVAGAFDEYGLLLEHFLEEKRTPEGGLVSAFDYTAALADERTDAWLEAQSRRLSGFDTDRIDTRRRALAFWINAYNYFMLEQILTEKNDGELVDSVWDYGGRYNPFTSSVFERSRFTIDGHDYSLDEIEKDILLGSEFRDRGWKDARVHFAVNCASVGCPPLRETIYSADNIERLLAENIRLAFNAERQLRVEEHRLYLSKLFKWYESDFVEAEGSILAFIRKWADEGTAKRAAETDSTHYIEYDWSLNRPGNFPEFNPDDGQRALD